MELNFDTQETTTEQYESPAEEKGYISREQVSEEDYEGVGTGAVGGKKSRHSHDQEQCCRTEAGQRPHGAASSRVTTSRLGIVHGVYPAKGWRAGSLSSASRRLGISRPCANGDKYGHHWSFSQAAMNRENGT